MAKVTYDDRSFLVDDERIWLVSGSIHYFRTPAGLWHDRLLKAKRAGLNCISTYVAWNFHEPQEGKWRLGGDHDVCAFVELARELGLYVILRPGPYICAEWDFGGLPAWLTTKTGMTYRTNNAAYTHYYDKYFSKVLPRLAPLQVTRGGNIILIQNENEYGVTTMPDRLAYLEFISQLFRRSGFDIPIINCNMFTDPPVPGGVECYNGWGREVQDLKRLRRRQRNAPMLVTEFWDGWFDSWGGKHNTRDAHEVARRAMEILGCGAQFNYYMWHGGTNFGFWGSHLPAADDTYQTTSYDYDAPLAEGGGLTDKYYLTKLVNMLAASMGRFFAASIMEEPGVSVHNGTCVLNISGRLGRWAIVTNNGSSQVDTARVSLPDGMELDVPLAPLGAAAVPVSLALTSSQTLDYCNLTPLGFFDGKVLVLHGPEGWNARISVNGEEIQKAVPSGEQPTVIDHQELTLVIVNSELAMRTWRVDDSLVFGPSWVGDNLESVVPAKGKKPYWILPADGKLTCTKIKPDSVKAPAVPRLAPWKRRGVCTEPVAENLEWTKMDRPLDADRLGIHYGYVWYRAEIKSDRIRKRFLFLPNCEDRATIYLNGALQKTWGRGQGATRSPIGATFKRGRNVLTILADNLGRSNFGPRIGGLKGVFGDIYDARPLRTVKLKLKAVEDFPRRIVPRHLSYLLAELERTPVWSAEADIRLTKVRPIHLSFTDVPHHLAVICNERTAGVFPRVGSGCGDVTLGSELKKGRNSLKLLLWGDVSAKVLQNIKLHVLEESVTQQASWSYRPWTPPAEGDPVVGKDQPAWYVTKFKANDLSRPLFLHINGAKKGQIYLNGHNVGRFWNIGPQDCYYLPSCWLAKENELLLFEEQGHIPAKSRLEFRPRGPYRD